MAAKYLAWFSNVDKHDIASVGGKGANLGEMTKAGFPVPFGFVVTAQAYYYFIHYNKLKERISRVLKNVDFNDPAQLHDSASHVRKLIQRADIPKDLALQIVDFYHQLTEKEKSIILKKRYSPAEKIGAAFTPPLVAVRSSATAEDLPDASFAGQQETYLNVSGENHLLNKVREAWASLFTDRATYYRANNGFDHMKVGLAAVVQRMVQSDVSGIAFSIDPVTNNKKIITIEAIFGLGEYIVQGKVTPDHYEVEKNDYKIVKKEINPQTIAFVKDKTDNKEIRIGSKGKKQKLADLKIKELAKIIHKVEKHYYFPQDIEWAMEGTQLFIVQSRPITTIDENAAVKAETITQKPILTGAPASPGVASGTPVFIKDPSEIDKIKTGDVLVARQTNPDYVPAMKKSAAIVTEVGGRTSHAAIVSRELGVPAVVGAEGAREILMKEKEITVDGGSGKIYSGRLKEAAEMKKEPIHSKAKTLTKIYVNLAQTERAQEIAKEHVDGVGLMRAEFIMGDIGVHPKRIIKLGHQQKFITKLASRLIEVVKPFSPRPVVYRATDFKTNEYHNLKGGDEFEQKEENPMLGFRGASRYIVWGEVFQMELEAIKKVRSRGYQNLHLMIPFVRTPKELQTVRDMVKKSGLLDSQSFKLWMMVEIPSNVILLEDFIKVGIDGISIGTNDLTMLILGVDRDNPEVANIYDERNPAVSWALKRIIRIAKKHGVTVSICGQAPSDYPEVVELLVNEGVTSMSVNPDSIGRVRDQVYLHEKLAWQKSKK